jgi:pyrimidine operon attenuation protein/uracil phosphoribosyltransferase
MQNSRQVIQAGTIDISFHRDDIGHHPIPKEIAPTQIPTDVHGAHVILIDDVLFSGRTVKAALDELFDHGRPTKVELAVLVDRGGRRLPLAADYAGLALTATEDQKVVVKLDSTNDKRDVIRIEPRRPAAQASA